MFNSVIKHDIAALEKRVADLEKELSSALKALAFLKRQLTTTRPSPGAGGMISREQWISDNPEQLELWPR
jgi:hypothetical protein